MFRNFPEVQIFCSPEPQSVPPPLKGNHYDAGEGGICSFVVSGVAVASGAEVGTGVGSGVEGVGVDSGVEGAGVGVGAGVGLGVGV